MTANQIVSNNDSDLMFLTNQEQDDREDTSSLTKNQSMWKLMVIDDDEAVHQVTRMVLEDYEFENQGLSIIQGYSANDARRLLKENLDTAVLMLDVVMETDHAGLELIPFIREELSLKHLRIVLRTGQPGQAPEKKVIIKYDINDYKEKSDLTADKLQSTITTALRGYKDLLTIEDLALSQSNLEKRIQERTKEILQINQTLSKEIEQREIAHTELRKSESRLAKAQLIANIGHWEWNIKTNEVTWSDQIFRILGLEPNAIPADLQAMFDATEESERDTVKDLFSKLIDTSNKRYNFEHTISRHDGKIRFVQQQGEILRDEQGKVTKLSGVIQDITERQLADEKVRQLSGAIEQIADAVMITDAEGTIEYVNHAFEKMTQYTSGEVIGYKPSILKCDRQSKTFYQRMWRTIIGGGVFLDVIINKKKSGQLYYEEKTITPQRDNAGNITHFISTGKDVTERMEAQERLHYLAHHDALTGLPNRALFQDRVNQVITRGHWHDRKIAILFLDLDRFKVINDSLGHDIGDMVLQTMSTRLTEMIREGDTVARLGGDEFSIILNDLASYDDVPPIADSIIERMTDPLTVDGHELFVTTSIGVSLFPKDSEDTQGLIKKADVAMYRAKSIGKNNFQFYKKTHDSRAAERLTLELNLRRALEKNEFFLDYQPQFKIGEKLPIGVEALIRWRNSAFKVISPLHFIPLLEETGMILPVSDWMMQTACAQTKSWQESGFENARISLNLSIRQFQRPGLVKKIEEILSTTGLDPDYLELEVTENLLIENITETANTLQELHELGVHLAIDDFGTGYSSMNYLKSLPFDNLKIDKSFAQDVTVNEDAAAITIAIISLAHALDMKVIAEGVETREQLQFLKQQHCDMVQGFLLGKPVTPDEILELVEKK